MAQSDYISYELPPLHRCINITVPGDYFTLQEYFDPWRTTTTVPTINNTVKGLLVRCVRTRDPPTYPISVTNKLLEEVRYCIPFRSTPTSVVCTDGPFTEFYVSSTGVTKVTNAPACKVAYGMECYYQEEFDPWIPEAGRWGILTFYFQENDSPSRSINGCGHRCQITTGNLFDAVTGYPYLTAVPIQQQDGLIPTRIGTRSDHAVAPPPLRQITKIRDRLKEGETVM